MAKKKQASSKAKANIQTDLLETLSEHVRRMEKLAPDMEGKDIIISSEFRIRGFREDQGVRKLPIAWPVMNYNLFYVVEVPAGGKVPKHSHDEAIFRILISGSLKVNGIMIDEPGTWWVVREFVEYEIETETGYKLMSAYVSNCRTGRQQARLARKQPPRS